MKGLFISCKIEENILNHAGIYNPAYAEKGELFLDFLHFNPLGVKPGYFEGNIQLIIFFSD